MFYQNDVYPADEYGTRECPEYREPCGAFYGVPFAGEVEDQPLYVEDQLLTYMPTRWFGRKDEFYFAKQRCKAELKSAAEVEPPKVIEKDPSKRAKFERAERLTMEFAINTQAPSDAVREFREYARAYVLGKNYLLNELFKMTERWMNRQG